MPVLLPVQLSVQVLVPSHESNRLTFRSPILQCFFNPSCFWPSRYRRVNSPSRISGETELLMWVGLDCIHLSYVEGALKLEYRLKDASWHSEVYSMCLSKTVNWP